MKLMRNYQPGSWNGNTNINYNKIQFSTYTLLIGDKSVTLESKLILFG